MPETIGFTGSRSANHRDAGWIKDVIDTLPADCVVVTGGCIGVDAFVAATAQRNGLKVHTVMPANRSRVSRLWRANCTTFEEMPPDTDYRDRNQRIVDLSDRLIAFPEYPEDDPRSRRSGTWQTVRMARRAGKPVEIHVLAAVAR